MAKEDHLYHKPTPQGLAKIEQFRNKVIELDALLNDLYVTGDGTPLPGPIARAKAIAQTKLEEFRQRGIEGIVRLHCDWSGGGSDGGQEKVQGEKAG